MTRKHIIIAIDPGTETGIVGWDVNNHKPIYLLESKNPTEAVQLLAIMCKAIEPTETKVTLLSERVDLNPAELRAKTQAGLRDALRVADSLWFLAQVYNIEYREILRSNSKNFVSDRQLKDHSWYNPSKHVRDALRVVITHLAETNKEFLKIWAN